MKEGYIIRDQALPHFITAAIVDWVDTSTSSVQVVFSRQSYREVIIDCFNFCIKNEGMILYSYVIMSNHIYMIVQSSDGKLSDLLRDFKKFTSKKIIQTIINEPESRREWMLDYFSKACEHLKREQKHKVWQDGYHAEHIYSNSFIKQKVAYIHNIPVKEKIVTLP